MHGGRGVRGKGTAAGKVESAELGEKRMASRVARLNRPQVYMRNWP